MELVAKGEKVDGKKLKQIQKEEGYSDSSILHGRCFQSKTWKQMKDRDLESFIAQGFLNLATPDNDDKRTRFASLKEMANLIDMYPGKNEGAELTIAVTRKYFNKKEDNEEGI
jgi:hypothetical protein